MTWFCMNPLGNYIGAQKRKGRSELTDNYDSKAWQSKNLRGNYFKTKWIQDIRQVKEIKGIQIGKEEVKLSIFADDMILYVKNAKKHTQLKKKKEWKTKLIRTNKQVQEVCRNRINEQKSNTIFSVFVNISNEQSKNEIKKMIQFIPIPQRMKYLGINLTKQVQILCTENYKILLKKTKEDLNK